MHGRLSLIILLLILQCPTTVNAQIAAREKYQYCYCPKANSGTGLLANEMISCTVSVFDASNINTLEITIVKTDGSDIGTDRVLVTAGGPGRSGKIISNDPMYRSNMVTVKYVKALFASNETSVAIYISLTRQGEVLSYLGPLTFYRSIANVDAICDKYCPQKRTTDKEPDINPSQEDESNTGKQNDIDPPVIKKFFIKENIYPTDDARALLKALNPGVDFYNPTKPLLYPQFDAIPPEKEKIYRERFRQQMIPDEKQNELFIANVNELGDLSDITTTSKISIDKSIGDFKYERFKQELYDLHPRLQRMNSIIYGVSSITSTALNEELTALNSNLKLVFQKRYLSFNLYAEALAYLQDLDFLLQPYFKAPLRKKDSRMKDKPSNGSKPRNGPNFEELNSEVIPLLETKENGIFFTSNSNGLMFYIYIYKDGATPLLTSKCEHEYKVWYKATAFINNKDEKYITDIPERASGNAVNLGTCNLVFYLQRDKGKLGYKKEIINTHRVYKKDKENPDGYKLIFYLSDLTYDK